MSGLNAYREHAVTTQSQGQLVVMLYEGAIKFLRQAVAAMQAEDYVEKGRLINKAVDIINELNVALDFESAEDISGSLRSLYQFMIRHLYQANLQNDSERIQDVIGLLEELNEGWRIVTA